MAADRRRMFQGLITGTGEGCMKEIDHIGVLVDNLEEAEAFLADVLELDPGKKLNTPEEGFRVAFLAAAVMHYLAAQG
jgi:catechol 2,3-dioxygenase-like lactoylglutathione lyase family enzyme